MENLYTFDPLYQRLLGMDINGTGNGRDEGPGPEERRPDGRHP